MNWKPLLHTITLVGATSIVFLLGCSSYLRDQRVLLAQKRVSEIIEVGDDIYEVKSILEKNGFGIKYGPGFPTESKEYLMMVIDYGEHPTTFETFKYSTGIGEDDGELISGVIRATPEGIITEIE